MNEMTIDQFHRLGLQRVAEIRSKGTDFQYEHSTKGFKALDNGDGSMFTEPHASFRKFQIITSKSGSCFVLDAEPQAGRTKIMTAPVTGRLAVFTKETRDGSQYTKAVTTLRQKGYDVPYSTGFAVVPGTVSAGDVVEIGGSKYEVTGKFYGEGGLDKLDIQPYTDPREQPRKTLRDSYAWNSGGIHCNSSTAFKIRH